MSLRFKTLLILGLIFALLVSILSVLFYRFGTEQFYAAERQDVAHDARHARAALESELAAMDLLNRDWASWDDTYAFVEDLNDAYIRSNIVDETFTNLRLNLILFVHRSGEVVFARAYDLESGEEAPVPPAIYDAISALTRFPDLQTGLQGLLLMPEGVMLVTARPILTSQGEGPSRGALIFGRYLTEKQVRQMSTHLAAPVAAYRWDRPEDWPDDVRVASPSLSAAAPLLAHPLDAEQIAGYALIPDIHGNPALILRVVESREIARQAQMALRLFIGSILILGLLFTAATLLLMDLLGLRRLAALTAEVGDIGTRGEPGRRVTVRGKDELADLARAVNDMLRALEQAQREREEQEARLLRLAEHSPDVLYRLAVSPPRLNYVSPAVTRILGYPPEDFYAFPRLIFRLIHPEDRHLLGAALRAELPPEEPLILRWITRKGETVWAEHRHTLVRDEAGNVTSVEGIARDITQQKRAEMEIAQLNAVLRAIRNVNQLISREKDRGKLLRAVCEELVNTRGYTSAWVVLTDGTPHLAAGAGRIADAPPDLVRQWEEHILTDRLRRLLDQPQMLVASGAQFSCPFLSQEPEAVGMMVRMEHAGQVYGLLCALLPANVSPSAEEQSLFAEVASDIAFALHNLEQEEALRRSQREWHDIFRAIGHPTFVLDVHHNVLAANQAALRQLGKPAEEVVGRKCYELFHRPEGIPAICPMEAALRSGKTETIEMEMETVLGTFLVSCTPVVDEQGRVEKVIHIATDITERKRAEKAMLESEERFRMLSEASLAGVYLIQDGLLRYVNPTAAGMFGYTPEEVIDRLTPLDVIAPEDREMVQEQIRRRFAGEMVSVQYQFRGLRKDGSTLECEVLGTITEYRGRPAILGTLLDITERKRAEEAYRVLVEHSLQGFAIIQGGRVVFANPALTTLSGYTVEELLSLSPEQLKAVVHPDDRERVWAILTRQLAGEPLPPHQEFRFVRKDGEVRWVRTLATRIEYQGSPAVQVAYIDITDQKRSEEKIRQQMAELQRWYEVTLGREGRVIELKREVNELLRCLGEPIRYPSAEE